ncbi:magnesium ion transporter [Mycoemilia scoparia]|uniref:Magnesium transporter n=1 Tax=Mycoemilia scoparia TaxID=417184 RepID=A0A9W7ZWP1_9FUNG|nr:magnesium ion transporter [Mycoemilia scoparia]
MNLKTDPVAKQELPRDNRSIIDYAFKNDPLFKPLESKAKHEKVYQHNHGGITLRCTEFNSVGDITVRAGEFSKIELCNEHGLQPRDLRRLDSHFVNQMPGILVRQKAILVNLLHIKAIIESDKLILFDAITMANDYDHGVLVRELQERLKEGAGKKSTGLPFEFRALESVLISVVERLQSDEEVLLNLVQNLLAYLEESVDRTKLRELLQYSKRLSRFEQRAGNIRDALEELLDNDEDLEDMYLSAKLSNEACETNDHEEIELLLETYLMRVEEVVNHIESVASHVRTTEDVVNIILDAQRNSLLLLEIKLTIFTLSLSAGTFITSIFGMNLLNTYEGNPYGFTIVTGAAGALGAILGVLGIRKMRSVLRRLK